jgi:hypothetical protein
MGLRIVVPLINESSPAVRSVRLGRLRRGRWETSFSPVGLDHTARRLGEERPAGHIARTAIQIEDVRALGYPGILQAAWVASFAGFIHFALPTGVARPWTAIAACARPQ